MPDVVVAGVRIAYRRRGSGAPLVLFHGAFEDSRIWADELERLSPHLDVVAWDAPGCGGSDPVPEGWSDADWADAASGFVTALGLRAPAVAGLSFGSMIALLLARDHPASVGGLVLVGAYAGWGGSLDADELAQRIDSVRFTIDHPAKAWADDFLDSVYAPDAPSERRELARRLLGEWRPATTAALLELMVQDLRPGLPAIQAPTVVVRGAADARSPRSASLGLCGLIREARLVEIADAGHDCSGPELDAVLIAAARDASAKATSSAG
ncbi:alpha/beta hydrolase [Cryobacterium sp. BB307]|uniref:alpha/beta fold hydrolase n=1 Tax=Cryobacterium sp. BB307 TaxID=2716317 RepID=UPI001447BE49|nr:alpha/beta hydrolase [Cryobacterium sp. BB307]